MLLSILHNGPGECQLYGELIMYISARLENDSGRNGARKFVLFSTGPNAYNAIFATLGKVTVFDSYSLDCGRASSILLRSNSSTAIPVPSVRLVVDFRDILSGCGDNASRVKLHACDRIVVGICVVYRTCSKVPYLPRSQPCTTPIDLDLLHATYPNAPV